MITMKNNVPKYLPVTYSSNALLSCVKLSYFMSLYVLWRYDKEEDDQKRELMFGCNSLIST